MSELLTKSGNHRVKKINDFIFKIEKDPSRGMRVPVTIYATDNLISKMVSDRTIDQAANVSTLPGVTKNVVVLPDGHEGYGFPVGGVAALDLEEGVISPGGVGYDINCGVRLLSTTLSEKDVKPNVKDLVNELFRSIPSGVGSQGSVKLTESNLNELLIEGVKWAIEKGYGWKQDAEVCEEGGSMVGADPQSVSNIARKRGSPQLGSLGSGNHFLEVQKVNRIYDEKAAKAMGITQEGQLTVLIHCGSRGLGHQICSDYLRISEIALRNRGMKLVYDVAHNIAKVERHKVEGEGMRDLVIHRKGATRAFPAGMDELPSKYYNIGQPVIIPGSMGTASWILLGNKKSLDLSFGSTAHGAGRTMSRSAAKRSYTAENVRNRLESNGIYVKAVTKDGVVEETPDAYKDVDEVVNVSHALGIATKVARLIPIGVIKG